MVDLTPRDADVVKILVATDNHLVTSTRFIPLMSVTFASLTGNNDTLESD